MEKRYEIIIRLRDHLDKLFEQCGLSPRRVEVLPEPKIVSMVEGLFPDTGSRNALIELDRRTVAATKKLEEIKLDLWSSEQDTVRMAQLENEHQELKDKYRELAVRYNRLVEQNKSMRSKLEQKAGDDKSLELIRSIITLRDTLGARLDWAAQSLGDDDNAVKLIRSQLKETAMLLKNSGVRVLDDLGDFDSTYCTVMETQHTDDPSKADTIAKVLRPGYEYKGEMLRSKEVVLYVAD